MDLLKHRSGLNRDSNDRLQTFCDEGWKQPRCRILYALAALVGARAAAGSLVLLVLLVLPVRLLGARRRRGCFHICAQRLLPSHHSARHSPPKAAAMDFSVRLAPSRSQQQQQPPEVRLHQLRIPTHRTRTRTRTRTRRLTSTGSSAATARNGRPRRQRGGRVRRAPRQLV